MKVPKWNRHMKNTDRERAWNVMRIHKGSFTRKDVARLSESSLANASKYMNTLLKAGYLMIVGFRSLAPKPGKEALYRLLKNTGPRPPIQKDLGSLYDPNTKSYWAEDLEKRLAD